MLPSDDDFMHRFRTRSACLCLAPVAYQSRYQKLPFFLSVFMKISLAPL